MIAGRCEYGSVKFEADQVRDTVNFCHCGQCRRTSGHHWAVTRAELDKFRITSGETLKWYVSSSIAKRGFCGTCGSSLFYQVNDADHIGIAAGCIDEPTGLTGGRHIFTGFKGDYYEIADGLPQVED